MHLIPPQASRAVPLPDEMDEARALLRRIQYDLDAVSRQRETALAELRAVERWRDTLLDELSVALEAASALRAEMDNLLTEVRTCASMLPPPSHDAPARGGGDPPDEIADAGD